MLSWFVCQSIILLSSVHSEFKTLETEHLRLIYFSGANDFLVPHVARCFENAYRFHHTLYDYTSPEKVTIFLHDLADYGNAGAGTIPKNHITVAIAPTSYVFETTPSNERMNATMNHELVHLVTSDQTAGNDRFFRWLFRGKVAETADHPLTLLYGYLTSPRRSTPHWYREGIAVFLDTWMAGGLGRALGGYDEMVFRTMVRDSSHFYDLVGLESEGTRIDFQVGVNSYLYGTRFMSYLALEYGPEKLIEWTKRSDGSKAYFASQFHKTYGLSMAESWNNWILFERAFQRENLDSIRVYPTTRSRPISHQALGSVSRGYYDASSGKLYAAVNSPGQLAHLAAIDMANGDIQKICDIKGPALYFVTSLAFDSTSGTLFYTTDNNDWRDLLAINIKSRKSRTLLKDSRVGDLVFNYSDSSIWGIRHFNSITTLVRIPFPYTEWNHVYSPPYGRDIYGLDISPDGKFISAGMAEISGKQSLVRFETASLLAGDTTHQFLFDFENSIPSGFVFSQDGNYLYGASYYTGVSNIFRYSFASGEMEGVTNSETGYFNPVPYSSDSLILFEYSGKGFRPVMIADTIIEDVSAITFLGQKVVEQHPIVKDWLAGSPGDIDIDSITTYRGSYHPLRNLRLVSAYPVVEGYGEFMAYGARLNFSGPIGIHSSDLTASYTPNHALSADERLHASWQYSHMSWTANGEYNSADFYDLFGPTKTSRKGYSLGVTYRRTLFIDGPKSMNYSVRLTGYGGLKRLPAYQNIVTSFDRFLGLDAKLGYSNVRASLGAVDYEKGFGWRLVSSSKYVEGHLFPRFYGTLDLGAALPLHHSSLWLRTATGFSPSNRSEPLANFYFGGFGNNWVDHQSVRRYRSYYAFPGIELNEFGGINFAKAMLEWNLPPLRFRHLGTPSFFASWLRVSMFGGSLVTNFDRDNERESVFNLGSQMDMRVTMLSHLKITFSVAYAAAFRENRRPSDEFMFSVKLL